MMYVGVLRTNDQSKIFEMAQNPESYLFGQAASSKNYRLTWTKKNVEHENEVWYVQAYMKYKYKDKVYEAFGPDIKAVNLNGTTSQKLKFTVEVTGGTLENKETKKEDCVMGQIEVVTADAPAAGQKFSHWVNASVNANQPISYNETYAFAVGNKDMHLQAIFVSDGQVVDKKGTTKIDSVVIKDSSLKVVAVNNIPDKGYKIKEAGILVKATATGTKVNKNDMVLGATGVEKKVDPANAYGSMASSRKSHLEEVVKSV